MFSNNNILSTIKSYWHNVLPRKLESTNLYYEIERTIIYSLFECPCLGASAIYQSGLYAMVAKFPSKYMQSYIIGQVSVNTC